MGLEEGREVGGDAAVEGELAIDVAEALARVDRGERRRTQGRVPPLRDGEPRDAAHPDLAGGPLLGAGPSDDVRAVPRFVLVPHRGELAARPPPRPRVDVEHRVAERAPAARVGTLERG